MGRPKKLIRSVHKSAMVPEDLMAQVDLELWSEVEGRIPHGAWQALLTELLREWIEKRKEARGKQ